MDQHKEEINKALDSLKAGGVVLYPTETVWGIGCDATDEDAIKKVIALKNRGDKAGLIVLVASDGMLQQYVRNIPDVAWELLDCSDSPLTLILPNATRLASSVLGPDGSVAIRVCAHPDIRNLITRFGKPMVSTSANLSGQPSAVTLKEVDKAILQNVDAVITRNEYPSTGKPSSIIKLGSGGQVEIVRR